LIAKRLENSIAVKNELLGNAETLKLIGEIAELIVKAYRNGKKVILFGNGGSAADAQHIAAELMGKYYLERDPLPAIALTVNTSSLTALGNDYSFGLIFARQLEALGEAGDVVIGISTSGDSENVIRALEVAKGKGLMTVGFTGRDGGRLKNDVVHYCLNIPSEDTPRIQEGHITMGHIICEIVERELFGSDEKTEA
jgi:D-sedoheptulose 7-phosphate isomerase